MRTRLMLAVAATLMVTRATWADTTIVADVDQISSAGAVHSVATTYAKNGMVRVERTGYDPILYDLKARKVYLLDSAQKSYSVVPFGELPPPSDTAAKLANTFQGQAPPDVKIKSEAQKKTVAGFETNRVSLDGVVKTNPLSGGSSWGAGGGQDDRIPLGHPAGPQSGPGGFPIGGIGSGGGSEEPLTVTMEGEFWVSQAVHSDDITGPQCLLPLYAQSFPNSRLVVSALPPLTDKMGSSFPLGSRVKVRVQPGDGKQIEIVTQVQSITTGPLDRGQFFPPEGYRQAYPLPLIYTH